MKIDIKIIAFLVLIGLPLAVSSQNNVAGKIAYSGTRLTYPLVEGWAKEFNKTYPTVSIALIPRTDTLQKADLKILAYDLTNEKLDPEETYTVVARYAQVPVTNRKNPLLAKWKGQGITSQELKDLYFKTEGIKEEKPKHNTVTIYTRDRPACATRAFAGHFNSDVKASKGIGVKGDDQTLLDAVKKDTAGVSYNNLGFVYDLKSRKVVDNISVIPVDLDNNGKLEKEENFYGTLDEVLAKLEGSKNGIAVDNVNFIYSPNINPAVDLFVKWVQSSKGQELNHNFGFLKSTEEGKAYSSAKK